MKTMKERYDCSGVYLSLITKLQKRFNVDIRVSITPSIFFVLREITPSCIASYRFKSL